MRMWMVSLRRAGSASSMNSLSGGGRTQYVAGPGHICQTRSKIALRLRCAVLGVRSFLLDLEHVGTADHLVDRPEAELSHVLTEVFGDVVEEIDDLFGLAGELRAQLGILGSDTNGAGVDYEVRLATQRLIGVIQSTHDDTSSS